MQLTAQKSLIILDAKKVEKDKYRDIKGNPTIFKDMVSMTVFPVGEKKIDGVRGNYNIYEKLVEVSYSDSYVFLPQKQYPKVILYPEKKDSITLIYSVHPKFSNEYVIVHYEGEDFWIIEQKRVIKKQLTLNPPGGTVYIKKFNHKSNLYLLIDGELSSFELKDKNIYSKFGHKKELKAFLKTNKIKLKKPADTIPLFAFMYEKGWI